eukprot:1156836-Pelagomonas_calceolata.AAC.1
MFCPGAASPAAGGGCYWCLKLRRSHPGLLLLGCCCDWAFWRGFLSCFLTLRWCNWTCSGVGTFDTVGACAAASGTAAAVCVGGGAGNAAAADGRKDDGFGLAAAAAATGGGGLQSNCLSYCPSWTALGCRKGSPGLGRRPAGKCWSLHTNRMVNLQAAETKKALSQNN